MARTTTAPKKLNKKTTTTKIESDKNQKLTSKASSCTNAPCNENGNGMFVSV